MGKCDTIKGNESYVQDFKLLRIYTQLLAAKNANVLMQIPFKLDILLQMYEQFINAF